MSTNSNGIYIREANFLLRTHKKRTSTHPYLLILCAHTRTRTRTHSHTPYLLLGEGRDVEGVRGAELELHLGQLPLVTQRRFYCDARYLFHVHAKRV